MKKLTQKEIIEYLKFDSDSCICGFIPATNNKIINIGIGYCTDKQVMSLCDKRKIEYNMLYDSYVIASELLKSEQYAIDNQED